MSTNAVQLVKLILLQILLFVGVSHSISQEHIFNPNTALTELKRLSDSAYGSDYELINGRTYYQKNLYATGTPLYLSKDWLAGSVTINKKIYPKLELKYNIETDELILFAIQKTGTSSAIVLNSYMIDSFSLGDHYFVNTNQFPPGLFTTGFVQIIYTGNLMFLATYSKSFHKDYSVDSPYGKYSDRVADYSIYKDQSLKKISSKKSLLFYFEINKKEIKRFIKQHKFKFKKANSADWKLLIEYCDSLSSVTK